MHTAPLRFPRTRLKSMLPYNVGNIVTSLKRLRKMDKETFPNSCKKKICIFKKITLIGNKPYLEDYPVASDN